MMAPAAVAPSAVAGGGGGPCFPGHETGPSLILTSRSSEPPPTQPVGILWNARGLRGARRVCARASPGKGHVRKRAKLSGQIKPIRRAPRRPCNAMQRCATSRQAERANRRNKPIWRAAELGHHRHRAPQPGRQNKPIWRPPRGKRTFRRSRHTQNAKTNPFGPRRPQVHGAPSSQATPPAAAGGFQRSATMKNKPIRRTPRRRRDVHRANPHPKRLQTRSTAFGDLDPLPAYRERESG
jgi:hypothetical protein